MPTNPWMRYLEFNSGLGDWIASYWSVRIEDFAPNPARHYVLPDGCVNLVYRYSPKNDMVRILGPRTEALEVLVHPGDKYLGVRFQPWANNAMVGKGGGDFKNQVIVLEDQLQFSASDFELFAFKFEQSETTNELDRYFVDRTKGKTFDRRLKLAIEEIRELSDIIDIESLADRLDISTRQLQRMFLQEVGSSPKEFVRIMRLRNAAIRLLMTKPKSWAALAAESGYADQSHFAREMRELVGLTPNQLLAHIGIIDHTLPKQ